MEIGAYEMRVRHPGCADLMQVIKKKKATKLFFSI